MVGQSGRGAEGRVEAAGSGVKAARSAFSRSHAHKRAPVKVRVGEEEECVGVEWRQEARGER